MYSGRNLGLLLGDPHDIITLFLLSPKKIAVLLNVQVPRSAMYSLWNAYGLRPCALTPHIHPDNDCSYAD